MKAFLGTGHLGSNFVRAMMAKGAQVQVWNRTTAKARALKSAGVRAFEQVTDAVQDADTIHLTLKDDHTVDEVLAMAQPAMKPGAIIIDHTTTSVAGAVTRTKEWKALGHTYLHAPVFMGPQNALESTGNMLVSGDQELISRLEPELSAMTGKLLNFGPDPGKAAGMKLIGNLFLIAFTAGAADTLSLARALGISHMDVLTLFDHWNPGAATTARIRKIIDGNYSKPTWELDMARKDAGLMMAEAATGGAALTVLPAVAALMDQWITKGHGQEDWVIISKDAVC